MSTTTERGTDRRTIDAADAARELGVQLRTLVGWAEAGHLSLFVPPGAKMGDGKRGPKGYKIWLRDWEAFKAANTKTGYAGAVEAAPALRPSAGPITGPDGIKRLKVRRHRD